MRGFIKFVFFLAVVGAGVYFGYPRVLELIEAQKAARESEIAAHEEKNRPSPGGAEEKPGGAPVKKETPSAESGVAMSEVEKHVLDTYPMPEIAPLLELVGDWEAVPARIFPREVELLAAAEFDLKRGGQVIGKRAIEAGSRVMARALHDGRLTISPLGSDLMTTVLPVDKTDFKAILEGRYRAYVERREEEILALRVAERARFAQGVQGGERGAPATWTEDGTAPIFEPMRASLAAGELRDHDLKDAKRWRWLGKETVGGVDYEAGIVASEVESIFGVFVSESKALIRNGRVERWVDPATGAAR
ncbi:MAG: hypothetical protein ACC661_01230 [Verrucomicrobiales bacterium]